MDNVLRMVVRFVGEWFDEDDEEESCEGRILLAKVFNFAEETVPNFTNRQFYQHFRMSCTTFESLLSKVQSLQVVNRISGNPETTVEKQLMIALWYLANIESFR